jgi:hypothetical protein
MTELDTNLREALRSVLEADDTVPDDHLIDRVFALKESDKMRRREWPAITQLTAYCARRVTSEWLMRSSIVWALELLKAYERKRAVDGLNDRPWDSSTHYAAEELICSMTGRCEPDREYCDECGRPVIACRHMVGAV